MTTSSAPTHETKAAPSDVYDASFWDRRASGAERSARTCVPILNHLLSPTSVIDIGCGQGHWLVEFQRQGIDDIFGVDGSYVLDEGRLLIPQTAFRAHDLSSPLSITRTFSLALCLEVAEHIQPQSARQLVSGLTNSAPLVVFSAAIPGQGGVGHVNEQWPWYWERLFGEVGFAQLDIIRPLIWKNMSIASWYRQNIFVYASQSERAEFITDNWRASDNLTLVSRETLENLTRPTLLQRAIRKAGRITGLSKSLTE